VMTSLSPMTSPRVGRVLRTLTLAVAVSPFLAAADETGCTSEPSSAVDQDRIHTTYWTLYAEDQDVTYARAQFRLGGPTGTTLMLSDGARVTFLDRSLGFSELLDWQEVQVVGAPSPGDAFVYTDVDANVFINPMPAPEPVGIPGNAPDRLLQSGAHAIPWAGAPLADDELMEMVIARESNQLNFVRIDARSPGSTEVVVPAGRLERLQPGAAVLVFRRHRDLPLEEGTSAAGKRTVTWQSPEHLLVLE